MKRNRTTHGVLLAGGLCVLLAAAPRHVTAAPIDDLSGAVRRLASPAPGMDMPELTVAMDAFRKGNVEECRRQLEAARRKLAAQDGKGELPPVDLMLARLYVAHGKVDLAKSMLEKIAVEHEGHPEVYLLFGNLALSEGRLADAMLHFEKSLNVGQPAGWNEKQFQALQRQSYAGQAAVSEQRQDWFKAQAALKQWAGVDAENAAVRDRLGAALFMLGRELEAFEHFQTAARQDAKMNPPEVSMGVMYARKQDFDNARKAFDAAQKRYPRDGRVHYELAGVLLLADRASEAKEHAEKAAQLGIDHRALTMQRGYIARQLRDFAEAEKHFSQLLDKSPSHFEAMNQLALVLVEQDDDAKRQRARELAELNVRRFPHSSYSLSTLGWVYYKLGRKDQALQALRSSAARPQVRTETLYYLARVLWENGNRDDARKVADQMKPALDQPGLFVLRPEVKQWFRTAAL